MFNAVRALEMAGVIVEDKDVTVAIHYRLAADPTRDLQALSVGGVHPNTPPVLFVVCDVTANSVPDVTRCWRWMLEQRSPPTAG